MRYHAIIGTGLLAFQVTQAAPTYQTSFQSDKNGKIGGEFQYFSNMSEAEKNFVVTRVRASAPQPQFVTINGNIQTNLDCKVFVPSAFSYTIGALGIAYVSSLIYRNFNSGTTTANVGPDSGQSHVRNTTSLQPNIDSEQDFTYFVDGEGNFPVGHAFVNDHDTSNAMVDCVLHDFHNHGYASGGYTTYQKGSLIRLGNVNACDSPRSGQCSLQFC